LRALRRIPLTIKTMVLVIIVGIAVWVGRDIVESRKMQAVFHEELRSRLEAQTVKARIRFDRYVKASFQLAKLLVGQERFWDHLRTPPWDTGSQHEVLHYRRPPPWYPPNSVVRAFPMARFSLLFDRNQRLREVYSSRASPVPPDLLQPTRLKRRLGRHQGYTTLVGHVPYLISTVGAVDREGRLHATLMLATPIDDEFLIASQGIFSSKYPLALLSANPPLVLASTDPKTLPPGTRTDALRDDYMIAGDAFFDYGDSEIVSRVAMLVPRSELSTLESAVVMFDRKGNAATAALFVFALALIILWIMYRIRRLSDWVTNLARTALGVNKAATVRGGDELMALRERFQILTQEVVLGQDAMRLKHEMERNAKQLDVLKRVTGELGVGVVLRGDDEASHWMNAQMEAFIRECGRDNFFPAPDEESGTIELQDIRGQQRVFRLNRLSLFCPMDLLLLQDVTELEAKRRALEYQALHDPLTGLPNRILLYDRLKQAIHRAKRQGIPFSMLMIDLNGFKEVNDTWGHTAGDEVLQKVAARLPTCVRASDTVCRLGGDEFAVILPEGDLDRARIVAKKLQKAFEQPFLVAQGVQVQLGASIGVVGYPAHGTDAETLLKHGDSAMYTAKRQRREYDVYAPSTAGSDQR